MKLTEKTILRHRSRQRTYTLEPHLFCRYCGNKGTYALELFDSDDWFCFHCVAKRPTEYLDPKSEAKLLGGEPEVIDRKEWLEKISPFDDALERAMNQFSMALHADMFGEADERD